MYPEALTKSSVSDSRWLVPVEQSVDEHACATTNLSRGSEASTKKTTGRLLAPTTTLASWYSPEGVVEAMDVLVPDEQSAAVHAKATTSYRYGLESMYV